MGGRKSVCDSGGGMAAQAVQAGLRLIAFRCPNLTLLKLSGCRKITDKGMAILSQKLKKFSCSECNFGAKGIIALLNTCSSLEELSVKYLHSGCLFEPLIIGSNNLKTLKLNTLLGDWDRSLEMIAELSLTGVNPSCVSLEVIATNCEKLVRITLSRSETINDVEMSCIAEKCVALKFLCIEDCGVSNKGIEALGLGCPNLANLKVTKCRKATREVGDLLRAKRWSLVVQLDPPATRACRGHFTVYLIVPTINLGPTAKSLQVIKLRSLEMIRDDSYLAEVHLEDVNTRDVSVSSLVQCHDLIALCIEHSQCTDVGLISIAENCKVNCYKHLHNVAKASPAGGFTSVLQ
nr:hypothetical protein [Tanacetum cinerariifolium]